MSFSYIIGNDTLKIKDFVLMLIREKKDEYNFGKIFTSIDNPFNSKFLNILKDSNNNDTVKKYVCDLHTLRNYKQKVKLLLKYIKEKLPNFLVLPYSESKYIGNFVDNFNSDLFMYLSCDNIYDKIYSKAKYYIFKTNNLTNLEKNIPSEIYKTYQFALKKNSELQVCFIDGEKLDEYSFWKDIRTSYTISTSIDEQKIDKFNVNISFIIGNMLRESLFIDINNLRFSQRRMGIADIIENEKNILPFISKISFSDGSEIDIKDGLIYGINTSVKSKSGWENQFNPGITHDSHLTYNDNNKHNIYKMFFEFGKISKIFETETGCKEDIENLESTSLYNVGSPISIINNIPYPNVIIKGREQQYCTSIHKIAYIINGKLNSVNDYPSIIEYKKDTVRFLQNWEKNNNIIDKKNKKIEMWHLNGRLHRENGMPAFINHETNENKWYLFGEEFNFEDYKKKIRSFVKLECEEKGICKDISGIIGDYVI